MSWMQARPSARWRRIARPSARMRPIRWRFRRPRRGGARGAPLLAEARAYALDWEAVGRIDDESLVNGIAQIAPFDVAARQALLEARDLGERADLLVQFLQSIACPARARRAARLRCNNGPLPSQVLLSYLGAWPDDPSRPRAFSLPRARRPVRGPDAHHDAGHRPARFQPRHAGMPITSAARR